MERRQIIRVILTLTGVLMGLIFGSSFFMLYALGLWQDGRWVPYIIYLFLSTPPVVALMIVFCLRWASGIIHLGHVLSDGGKPTVEECRAATKSVFRFARNGALWMAFLFISSSVILISVLYFRHNFSPVEVFYMILFNMVTGINLGIVTYYAIKMVEQFRLDYTAERLFGAGVYEFPHFKLKIWHKIMAVTVAIVAYLLCAAMLMSFNASSRIQQTQLEEKLTYWAGQLPPRVLNHPGVITEVHESQREEVPKLGDRLGYRSRLTILNQNGEPIFGDKSDLGDEDVAKILESDSGGVIKNYKHQKMVAYKPFSDYEAVAAVVGFWNPSEGTYRSTIGLVALIAVTLFLSLVAVYFMVTDINHPLKGILEFVRSISRGEEGKLSAYSEDEMGQFSRELARTTELLEAKTRHAELLIENIRQLVRTIQDSVTAVNTASGEQLEAVHEQASSVQEAMTTAREVVATAEQIEDSAKKVQGAAEKNLASCRSGSDRVGDSLQGLMGLGEFVEQISESVQTMEGNARQLEEVVSLIEEISNQVNMLSLNAQIEAAGVTERARQFETVAGEVRRLSQNTMDAIERISNPIKSAIQFTEEVNRLVNRGQKLVDKGSELADSVNGILHEIEAKATDTNDVAKQIAIVTSQQKTASEQLEETISEIHDGSQQIIADSEEISAATNELVITAERLAKTLGQESSATSPEEEEQLEGPKADG